MTDWRDHAACIRLDMPFPVIDEIFFPHQGQSAAHAKRICAACPVADDCRAAAQPGEHGVWGGTSEFDRRTEHRARNPGKPRHGEARNLHPPETRNRAITLYERYRPHELSEHATYRRIAAELDVHPDSVGAWIRAARAMGDLPYADTGNRGANA